MTRENQNENFWTPPKLWNGQTAIVVGGGDSLRTFPVNRLRGRNVVSCNHGYKLGDLIQWLFFHDNDLFLKHWKEIKAGPFHTVTCDYQMQWGPASGIATMRKVDNRISEGATMGWYGSAGQSATQLAYRLGASTIFLLGIDCTPAPVKMTPKDYSRFLPGWQTMLRQLKSISPETRVVNVNDCETTIPESQVERMSVDQFLTEVIA